MTEKANTLVIGLDFGSDSGRCALINAENGEELAVSQMKYPRWEKGDYCDPVKFQFRQHPQDYLEVLKKIVTDTLHKVPGSGKRVKAISLDMTGSTPAAVDKNGVPLALKPEFAHDPNAMFVMWKDHTGQEENERINVYSRSRESDYTRSRLCGNYSIEHFWTKALHIFKDKKIREEAHSFVEASDWLPGVLTGNTKPEMLKRGMGIAASRVLWNKAWGGYPPNAYFKDLDVVLDGLVETFDPMAYTCDQAAGKLAGEWARYFGLSEEVIVTVGNLDCHAGAIGAGVKKGTMVEIIGTSTVAITVGPFKKEGVTIPGVPQQALNMIIPGEMGYEGGQSAFGDLYNWFKEVLMWPIHNILRHSPLVDDKIKRDLIEELDRLLLPELTRNAGALTLEGKGVVATDWINGRRSPHADFDLTGTISGLDLSSSAPVIYKSLVEATALGAKFFIEQFRKSGGELNEVIAVGGISKKSPFVMQILADVLEVPIKVLATEQACSLGVGMCAAVAAGFYSSIPEAQEAMGSKIETIYRPEEKSKNYYERQYRKYLGLEQVKEIIK